MAETTPKLSAAAYRDARVGEAVAGRFELEELSGRGGMGVVYRARDLQTGEPVALKLLSHSGAEPWERFRREAKVLASLRHPAIVRHLDDGSSEKGELYIAMEWLEGEPLSTRIARAPIGLRDAVALVRRVCEALGVAHAAGVVHRDLKPGNLFLRDGKLEGVALLDFGLARLVTSGAPLTRTEAVLGTPGYMSPEQASGQPDVDARADVFAVGCLLYELVTRVAPFRADTFVASLARVLLEDPPLLGTHAPHVPPGLEALVTRMLSKAPQDRPHDASSVVSALRELEPSLTELLPRENVVAQGLGEAERRVVSVILARATSRSDPQALSQRHGARFDRLADGSLLATFAGPNAVDQAERAAAVAAAVAKDGTRVAVATGMSELGRGAVLGDAVARAAALLDGQSVEPVQLDKLTARLVEARSDPAGPGSGAGETSFVGRARELALLEAIFDECASEPVARAVLVVAPAGMGKSRLLAELVARLEARGDAPQILIGRSDAIGAGSSFAALATVIRRAAGTSPDEDIDAARQKLGAYVTEMVAPAEAARVSEFLGELAGVPFAAAPGSALQAARRDPSLSGDQMRRAAEDWLAAGCARGPMLLVFDDLHWADSPTVQLLDSALRTLARQPLMVLALARPEVRQTFPALWSGRNPAEVSLGPLLPSAAAVLVRARLGAATSPAVVDEIVSCADGHPFLLDELARAEAGGSPRGKPETAIAFAQTTLDRVEADARRVLRAASVFGGAFRKEGIAELVGGGGDGRWLEELEQRQLLRRGADAADYVFRHDLLREAAYATLTEADRRLAHGLAGQFLEASGCTDAITLARHFERGVVKDRAAHWYRRSAELALEGNDIAAVLERVSLAVSAGAADEELGRLWLLRAEAHKWRGENQEAEEHAARSLELLRAGTREWFRAAAEVAAAAGKLRHKERLTEICKALLEADASLELDAARTAWARTATQLAHGGMVGLAAPLFARIEAAGGPGDAIPQAAGFIFEALAVLGDELARIRFGEQGVAAFEAAGDERNGCMMRLMVGFGLNELGGYRRSVPLLRAGLVSAERLGLHNVQAIATTNLGRALFHLGHVEEGTALTERALKSLQAQGSWMMQGAAHSFLATIALGRADLAVAEQNALAAIELTATSAMRPPADATLARVRLAQGRPLEALASARAATDALARVGERTMGKGLVRLVLAEALHAAGREDEARAALHEARDRIVSRAAELDEPLRADFLGVHPEHARTLRWAAEWLDH